MKRIGCLVIFLLSGTVAARADYQKGSHAISLSVGGAGYGDDFDINNGDNRLRDEGAAGAVQYLYYIRNSPTIGVGADILGASFSDQHPSSFLDGSDSHADAHTTLYQAIAKLTYPKGWFRPYLIGGAGLARSSLHSYITPGSGVVWPDTNTSETRQTFDSVKHGGVLTWGIGTDVFIGERIFLGLEFRQSFMAKEQHQPTDFGQSKGITSAQGPGALAGLLLKIGFKFGS